MQDRAIFNHDGMGLHVAGEFTSARDVDALTRLKGANHLAADDHFMGLDFGADSGVWADPEGSSGKTNSSFELTIEKKITLSGDFAFHLDALAHGGRR